MSKKEDVQIIDAFSDRKVNHIEPLNRTPNMAEIITGIATVSILAGVGVFMSGTITSVLTNTLTYSPVYSLLSYFPILISALMVVMTLKIFGLFDRCHF